MTDPKENQDNGSTRSTDEGPVPFMQRIMDNPFILLFLGIAMPAVLYLVWGVIEVANIPIAN